VQALAAAGRDYALYVNGGGVAELGRQLPAGRYNARWVDTRTGDSVERSRVRDANRAARAARAKVARALRRQRSWMDVAYMRRQSRTAGEFSGTVLPKPRSTVVGR
jgi:hypothetical protein